MGLLDFIFGTQKRQVEEFLKNGAVILDVRTQREWDNGHIDPDTYRDSKHIPLDDLHNHIEELKQMNKTFIVCCESGIRATKAAKFLHLNHIEATNGGGWMSLKKKL